MNPMTRIAAVAAVLVVAVGVAYLLFRPTSNVATPASPSPTSSPTITPTPAPTSVPRLKVADVDRTLAPGTYHTDSFPMDFTFTVPAGWNATEFTANSLGLSERGDASVGIYFVRLSKVYPDPCHTAGGPQTIDQGAGPLVAALSAMPGFNVDNVQDTIFGGATATTFRFGNDINVAAAGCSGAMLPFGTRIDGLGHDTDVAMFGGEYDQFWVIDFGQRGTILVAVTDNRVAMVQGVLDSLLFDGPATGPVGATAAIPAGSYDMNVPVADVEQVMAAPIFTDQDKAVIVDSLGIRNATTLTVRFTIGGGTITIQHAADHGTFNADGTWPTPSEDAATLGIKYNPTTVGHIFTYAVQWNPGRTAFRLVGGGTSTEVDVVSNVLFLLLAQGEFARAS